MLQRSTLTALGDFERPLSRRVPPGVYFARLCDWSEGVRDGLARYRELARQRGVVIEGGLANPDAGQIDAMTRALGADFRPTADFAREALGRWMPAMSDEQRRDFAEALAWQYRELDRQGKPEGAKRNLYVKLLCWLRYRFGALMPLLAGDVPPRLLYWGSAITAHELTLLRVLNMMGADALLVEPEGDGAYLRLDPDSRWSQRIAVPGGAPFPKDVSLKSLAARSAPANDDGTAPAGTPQPAPQPAPRPAAGPARPMPPPRRRIVPEDYFPAPKHGVCANRWMKEADVRALLTLPAERGSDPALLYTAYIRLAGVRDTERFPGELKALYLALKKAGRRVLALDGPLPEAAPEELAALRRRGRYASAEELTVDLAGNLPGEPDAELTRLAQRSFLRVMADAAKAQPDPNRLLEEAARLLCRIRRYYDLLKWGTVPVFMLMNGCRNSRDALFVRWLSGLPADVLLIAPDLAKPCLLADPALLELRGERSIPGMRFPWEPSAAPVSTDAASAERDLDALLYAGSGLYRNRQLDRADSVTLRTTLEELFILWDQELKYRPGFDSSGDRAALPVLYAKLSGVEKGRLTPYWQRVKRLAGGDALLFKSLPLYPDAPNPHRDLAAKALKNGRLRREALKADPRYPFGHMGPFQQEHLLDALQRMLDGQLIKGTFVNGVEYAVVATVLNLDRELIRRIQGFDFSRKNPKLVCVHADEGGATLEDAILLTFLNLIGFDIALFVPTGYRTVERFLAGNLPVEHQLGEYMYDLRVPDLDALPPEKGPSLLDRLLGRER